MVCGEPKTVPGVRATVAQGVGVGRRRLRDWLPAAARARRRPDGRRRAEERVQESREDTRR